MGPATVELDGQYRLLREEAGLVDRSERAKLVVRGPEAADYLQGQLTNEVEALAPPSEGRPGAGCYAALLDRKGHMQGDMRVLRLAPDALWLDLEPVAAERVRRHLSMYKVGREVEVEDVTAEHAILSVIGPAAGAALGDEPLGTENSHRVRRIGDLEVRVVATDLGADLICAAPLAEGLRSRLDLEEVSPEAAEIIRVEAGRPRFGAEMSESTIPQEAGINERAISFTKGCYIGQETVARLHYKGKPNRFLRGLRLEAPAGAGEPVRLGERELGRVGTVALSPALGPIALAVLRREGGPGDVVEVGETRAEVVELPFRPDAAP